MTGVKTILIEVNDHTNSITALRSLRSQIESANLAPTESTIHELESTVRDLERRGRELVELGSSFEVMRQFNLDRVVVKIRASFRPRRLNFFSMIKSLFGLQ